MKLAWLRYLKRCLAACLALALVASPARAGSVPDNLSDIAYQDSSWGKQQLRSRGYTRISFDSHQGRTWEYWWNGASNTCVKLQEVDGKYASVATTSSTDCNQHHDEATKSGSGAAIAIGAAALLGVAVLAHQSHERDEKHGKDEKSVAEFERGYRDGLYHQPYHDYQKTDAYSDGYSAGQRKRDDETDYRSGEGYHSGHHPYVSLTDLVGARASSFDSEIRSRGFNDKGGYKQDGRSFAMWWNHETRQCVQAVTQDGRIKRIESIPEGNCT